MMQGRYLLACKLVDTHGVSPFSLEVDHDDWQEDLQAFSWLRHFRDARTDEERRFARTLTLDWIGREGQFSRDTWSPALTARRVLNWLRHYNILLEGASPEQAQQINRSLSTQISSLKLRAMLTSDPVDALLVAIALVGVTLCADRPNPRSRPASAACCSCSTSRSTRMGCTSPARPRCRCCCWSS